MVIVYAAVALLSAPVSLLLLPFPMSLAAAPIVGSTAVTLVALTRHFAPALLCWLFATTEDA